MTEEEAKAIDRELSELRFQVIEVCQKYCGVSLSWCNAGEALSVIAERLRVANLEHDPDPADSNWAEEAGFRWSTDGTAMVLSDGGWEVLLTGDVAGCEKDRGLSLYSPQSSVGGIKTRAVRVLLDDPTRGDVRRLCSALGIELKEPA